MESNKETAESKYLEIKQHVSEQRRNLKGNRKYFEFNESKNSTLTFERCSKLVLRRKFISLKTVYYKGG